MLPYTSLLLTMACGIATAAAAGEKMTAKTTFHVRIENVSTPTTLRSSSGDTAPAPNSFGLWIVHTAKRVGTLRPRVARSPETEGRVDAIPVLAGLHTQLHSQA